MKFMYDHLIMLCVYSTSPCIMIIHQNIFHLHLFADYFRALKFLIFIKIIYFMKIYLELKNFSLKIIVFQNFVLRDQSQRIPWLKSRKCFWLWFESRGYWIESKKTFSKNISAWDMWPSHLPIWLESNVIVIKFLNPQF